MSEVIPTFLVPYAEDREQAERVWKATKEFIEQQGFKVKDRRIYAMSYVHDGKACYDKVGSMDRYGLEEILVLLDAGTILLCCTANRGVLRGFPILTGVDGTHVIEFAKEVAP